MNKLQAYYVKPGSRVNLDNVAASENNFFKGTKDEALEILKVLSFELNQLQQTQQAEKKHKILIVFQGLDASGKDGAIRNVFNAVNPSGVHVAHFGAPTSTELSHDYLWRIHKEVPAKGEMVIFNRSHYEDVLIVRVQNLMSEEIWRKRYNHIIDFEKMLADEGTTVLKFYLHISNEEQRKRLQERVDNPDKHWKIDPMDFKDRLKWNDYIAAYNEVLSKTSKIHSPWFIIPSDRKWYRDILISSILVERLKALKMKYPKPKVEYKNLFIY